MKDIYVVGDIMVVKWPTQKVFSSLTEQSLIIIISGKDSADHGPLIKMKEFAIFIPLTVAVDNLAKEKEIPVRH